MAIKINPTSVANPDTGFGIQGNQIGGRFINKDGSFNLRKEGLPLRQRISVYSWLLELSWLQFLGLVILFYLVANVVFTLLYILAGIGGLQGFASENYAGRVIEIFFFSTETITTVGYGRINPVDNWTHIVASLEAMTGWLSLALITGLLYGRFSRPKAYIAFSEHALISPYKNGVGLMFRMVPYKINHHLTDARVVVNVALIQSVDEKPVYQFYQLKLERSRIDTFNMNWTVVHPIDNDSPLLNFTNENLEQTDLELYVQVTGFDHIFSNMVMQRTSYTYKEIVWGAKFNPMYHEATAKATTVLNLDMLNAYDRVQLETISEN